MKKRKEKYLNIMIIPDSTQQIKSFKISIPFIKTTVTVAFLIIMVATAFLVYFSKTTLQCDSRKR